MKYKVVVIDFPWKVSSGPAVMRKMTYGGFDYKMMPDRECLNFPIDDYAAERSTLFMWTVSSKTRLAHQIMETWGYKFYCYIVWDKVSGTCINGMYQNHELCLYGYRGRYPKLNWKKPIKTIIRALATKNSEKPDKFYRVVRRTFPGPRIDIFARKRHDGFDAYGDQVEPAPTTTQVLLT